MSEPLDVPMPKGVSTPEPSEPASKDPRKPQERNGGVVEEELRPGPAPQAPPVSEPLQDYEHLPEDQHPLRDFLKVSLSDKRVIALLAVLLSMVIVWFAGRPLYREVKVWRAIKLMERCQAAADAGNIPAAMNLMRQAVLMAPTSGEVFRLVRLFNAGIGDVPSVLALQHRMISGEADPEELIVLGEQSLKGGQSALVGAVLEKLAGHVSARKTILEMKQLDANGNIKGAVDLARATLPSLDQAEANKLVLAAAEMLLLRDVDGSQEILRPLMGRSDGAGLAALRLLARQQLARPGTGSVSAAEVAAAMSRHSLATSNDKLLEADLRIAQDPSVKAKVVSWLMAAFSAPNMEGGLDFARWLNRRQAHAEAIEFIGRDRALGDAEWLLVYLDAHAALDRWGDVISMLDAETVAGLSDGIRLMFLARAAEKSGEAEKADEAWREMQSVLTYEKPEVASFVANYAVRIGQLDQAFKAFATMSKQRETSLQGYLGMIRTFPLDAPLEELVGIYKEFLEEYPNIGEAHVDLVYLQLLTGQETAEAAAKGLEIFSREPNSLAALSVAALGMLKDGSPWDAAMLYEGKSINWHGAPDPWKAVRVAVLRANGNTAEADALEALIKAEKLRPLERDLLGRGLPGSAQAR